MGVCLLFCILFIAEVVKFPQIVRNVCCVLGYIGWFVPKDLATLEFQFGHLNVQTNSVKVEVQKILHCSLAPEPNLVLDCRCWLNSDGGWGFMKQRNYPPGFLTYPIPRHVKQDVFPFPRWDVWSLSWRVLRYDGLWNCNSINSWDGYLDTLPFKLTWQWKTNHWKMYLMYLLLENGDVPLSWYFSMLFALHLDHFKVVSLWKWS